MRTKSWYELAEDADWLADEIGDEDEAAANSARFVAVRLRRLAQRPAQEPDQEG